MSYSHEISFILCSMIGGMMHYTKKFLRKETDVSMAQWFGKSNWIATVYTIIMFIFVSIGALAGGVINAQTDFWAVLYTGFVTGFAVDAGFNSDKNISQAITEVRSDTRELFKKDDADEYASPNPQLDDPDEPRRSKRPVAGSPTVPPKPIF